MAEIHTLHPEKETAVTLTGAEWLAIMLKLAGRGHDTVTALAAEARIIAQMAKAG